MTSFLGPLIDRLRRVPALRRLRDTKLGDRLAWRLTGLRAQADGYEAARLARLATKRCSSARCELSMKSLARALPAVEPGWMRQP